MTVSELQHLKHLLQTPPSPRPGGMYATAVISQENQHFYLLKPGTSSCWATEMQAQMLSKELLYVNTTFPSIHVYSYLLTTGGKGRAGSTVFFNASELFCAK